jgi:hypothetical protein
MHVSKGSQKSNGGVREGFGLIPVDARMFLIIALLWEDFHIISMERKDTEYYPYTSETAFLRISKYFVGCTFPSCATVTRLTGGTGSVI